MTMQIRGQWDHIHTIDVHHNTRELWQVSADCTRHFTTVSGINTTNRWDILRLREVQALHC